MYVLVPGRTSTCLSFGGSSNQCCVPAGRMEAPKTTVRFDDPGFVMSYLSVIG